MLGAKRTRSGSTWCGRVDTLPFSRDGLLRGVTTRNDFNGWLLPSAGGRGFRPRSFSTRAAEFLPTSGPTSLLSALQRSPEKARSQSSRRNHERTRGRFSKKSLRELREWPYLMRCGGDPLERPFGEHWHNEEAVAGWLPQTTAARGGFAYDERLPASHRV